MRRFPLRLGFRFITYGLQRHRFILQPLIGLRKPHSLPQTSPRAKLLAFAHPARVGSRITGGAKSGH